MSVILCVPDPADKKLAAFVARSFAGLEAPELIAEGAFSRSCKKKAPGAFVYFDAALGFERLLELAEKLGDLEDCGWGVLDPGGVSQDPATYFFAGASDYVGPAAYKSGLSAARLDQALAYAGLLGEEGDRDSSAGLSFPGWSALSEGDEIPVRFCYAAVGNQKSLLERIGDKRLNKLREDFAVYLEPWAKECGGIVWIKESAGCLVLFPPVDEGMNPVLAAFRLLLDRALVGYEVFKLEVPLSFRFAFHSGHTQWRKPGATGSVVSEDVNFVFHLGMKAAGDGYILSSDEADGAIPDCLRDLFSAAGDFEGHSLKASRRFKD
jgi:hypothetical protein